MILQLNIRSCNDKKPKGYIFPSDIDNFVGHFRGILYILLHFVPFNSTNLETSEKSVCITYLIDEKKTIKS